MNKFKSNITKVSAAALLGTFGLVAAQQIQANPTTQTVKAATEVGTINYVPGYGVAVRSTPKYDNNMTGQYLKHGTSWKVIKTATDANGEKWVDLGKNQWIPAKYLATAANKQMVVTSTTRKVVQVKSLGYSVSLYSDPNNGTLNGQQVQPGSKWNVVKTAKAANGTVWYDLGLNQWIAASNVSDYTAPSSQSATASTKIQAVINLAKKQLGKPYQWGGKGPAAFDCSGLMYYVFLNATGKNIGGWTVPQESAGRQVSVSQLQAGDLVFWGSHGNTYHVGLYLGNNQYLDAPQPGKRVQIASLSSYNPASFGVRVF